jgi:hypothetical protein
MNVFELKIGPAKRLFGLGLIRENFDLTQR